MKTILTHVFILFFGIVILIPFLTDNHVVRANDLNGTDLHQIYFSDSIRKFHQFPEWNPYMQQGIPMVADPLYSVFNPLIGLSLLIMSTYDFAIKMIYIFSIFMACETMLLLSHQFIKNRWISLLISLTYGFSGFMAARITAGHIESVVPYGILPFVVYSFLQVIKRKSLLWSGIAALSLVYVMFSGSIYFVAYWCYALIMLSVTLFFKDKKAFVFLLISGVLFAAFSAIKILPAIELQSFLEKTKEPFLGSQTVVLMIRYLFIPFNQPFALLGLSKFISTAWGDLEKTSYIGIFILIILALSIKYYKKIKIPNLNYILILFISFFLILMPDWKLNPFHYLILFINSLSYFRVPSRAYPYFIITILLFAGIFSEKFSKIKK